jgi:hypothetical protein
MNARRRVRFSLLAIAVACGLGSWFATAGVKVIQTLTGDDALQHLGETNTVCGTIASAKYAVGAPGNPTYLNFDRPYPQQSCSVLIAEPTRAKFRVAPERAFPGKWVCVTGVIMMDYRGKAQIVVSNPAQIVVEDAPSPPSTN